MVFMQAVLSILAHDIVAAVLVGLVAALCALGAVRSR